MEVWDNPEPGFYQSDHWSFRIPEPEDNIGLRFHLKPYTKPHPPIALGGGSPYSGTLVIAGQNGWIPISLNLLHNRVIKTHWDAVTDGAKKSNLVPDRKEWRIAREVYIADTTEEARKHVMEGVLKRDYEKYWFNLLSTKENMKSDINLPDSDVDVEYLMDNLWIVGSPDDALEQIKELYDDVGGFGVLLAMGHEWEPKEHWINSMTLLADEVMPKLAHI